MRALSLVALLVLTFVATPSSAGIIGDSIVFGAGVGSQQPENDQLKAENAALRRQIEELRSKARSVDYPEEVKLPVAPQPYQLTEEYNAAIKSHLAGYCTGKPAGSYDIVLSNPRIPGVVRIHRNCP